MVDCCPSPNNPVILPTLKTERQRKSLHALMYGEVGAAVCRAYTFGFLTGLLHLISMWIDYLGYATMHYCQVMVIAFCGGIEVMMLWMNANDGGPLEEAVNESSLTVATYYCMLLFSATKFITGMYVYQSFKREYVEVYGDNSMNVDAFYDQEIDAQRRRQQAQQDRTVQSR